MGMNILICIVVMLSFVVATEGRADNQHSDTLYRILSTGTIKVCNKVDYPPYGSKNEVGEIVGFEADLAADVATQLKVKLEKVPVVSANRIAVLQSGKCDLIIATMSAIPGRGDVVGFVQPFYMAGSENIFVPRSSGVRRWEDVDGKVLCGVDGAYYNNDAIELGARILSFKDGAQALAALRDNKCTGFIYDTTYFAPLSNDPVWADYGTLLTPRHPRPWAIGVVKGDARFLDYMSRIVTQWHVSGKLIELEDKWAIPHSLYLQQQHDIFLSK